MNLNLLSAATSRIMGKSTATVPPAPVTITQPAPAASTGDETVDVVTLSDASAAAITARAEGHEAGMAAERTRTAAVLASDAGKANPAMAAFMLEHNPTASAEAITAKLALAPAAAAPVAAVETPAITTPLAETPKVVISPTDPGKAENQAAAAETDRIWDDANKASAASLNLGTSPTAKSGY